MPTPIYTELADINGESRQHEHPALRRTDYERATNVVPTNFGFAPGNIRRYGAAVDGVTDDAEAIRRAFTSLPASGGRVFCDPPGEIKVGSVVYIPQRTESGGYGIDIDFTGCTLIGQGRGVGTIFESGKGLTSSASNFGEADEAYPHYHTTIRGAMFKECGSAIRIFNFLKACKLQDLYFVEVDEAVYALRCFYLDVYNCHAQVTSINAGDVLFNFDGLSNAITVIGCEAGGGIGNITGIGYRFSIGGGVTFIGNTAEGMDTGLVIAASMPSIDIRNCYFESLETCAIDASASGAKRMDVSGNWFLFTGKAISAAEWIAGTWSDSNDLPSNDTVEILDSSSYCTIEIPLQIFTEATSTASADIVPSNYTVTNSVILRAPRMVYANAIGTSAPIVIDSGASPSTPEFAYAGGPVTDGAGTFLPFCDQTLSSGSSVIDTQITWSEWRMAALFDLPTQFSGSIIARLQGIVFSGGSVFRADGYSTFTVTASNSGGKLRLTIAGSGHSGKTMDGFPGQVRHV